VDEGEHHLSKVFLMRLILTYTLVLFALHSFGQGGSAAHVNAGDRYFDQIAYAKAIPEYQAAVDQGAVNEHVTSRLAECHLRLNQPEQAEYWYATVVKFLNIDPVNYYNYAQALKSNGHYDEAEKWMDRYLTTINRSGSSKSNISDFARKFAYDMDRYKVTAVSTNSEVSDFGPTWCGETKLIFVSSRRETVGIKRRAGYNNQPFLDLYSADIMPSGDMGGVRSLKGDVNSKLHEGPATCSSEGHVIYFTRNDLIQGKSQRSNEGVHHLNIYLAKRSGDSWGDITQFKFNKSSYSVGHPTISEDGTRLFFASDMPGGQGGADIYYCELVEGQWTEPMNLGTGINTDQDELFPYIAADATLYFASNGHPGLGGLDVFAAPRQSDGGYELSINMGAPVNSPRDDFGLIIDRLGKRGYFSSNRPGGKGDDDIYQFEQLSALAERFLCTGQIISSDFDTPLPNVSVELMDASGTVVERTTTDPEGKFVFPINKDEEYVLRATADGSFEAVQHFDSYEIEKRQIISSIIRMENESGLLLRGVCRSKNAGFVADMNVTVVNLSTFETQLVETGQGGDFTVRLEEDEEYEVVFEKKGYFSQSVPVSTLGLSKGIVDINSIRPLVFDVADVGKPLLVERVKWKPGSDHIDKLAKVQLELLTERLMLNPSMIIELGVHTDSRGSASDNLAISQKRADAVREYLVVAGIRSDRATAKGYGSSRVLNKCIPGVECTEEEHEMNNRLEYIVTGYTQ
jgi:hypothetical protein